MLHMFKKKSKVENVYDSEINKNVTPEWSWSGRYWIVAMQIKMTYALGCLKGEAVAMQNAALYN